MLAMKDYMRMEQLKKRLEGKVLDIEAKGKVKRRQRHCLIKLLVRCVPLCASS